MPYLWEQGCYKMDIEALQRRLKRARLVLGDVRETVPARDYSTGFMSLAASCSRSES
jgi:hypothetical protein